MFTNLSYKKKNLLLLAATLVFIFTGYELSIKKTWTTYEDCKVSENQLQQAFNAPQKIERLEKKLISIDNIIGISRKDSNSLQESLLGIVSAYCQQNNITLKEFPKAISTREKDLLVETNVFVVQGGFAKLLKLVFQLEQKYKIGKLASVDFHSKKNMETKNTTLTETIYLRNIKKVRNEK